MSAISVGPVRAESGEKAFGYLDVYEGAASMLRVPVWIINGRRAGPRVAITAGIHASEYAGIEAAMRIARAADPADLRGALLVFPVINVPGFEAGDVASNPIDGESVNRLFPGDPNGSPSRVLAHVVFEAIRGVADAAVDLHGGNAAQALATTFSVYCEVGGGDVDPRSRALAEAFGAPVVWTIDGRRYGAMLISALSRAGIPAAIGEAGDLGLCREEDVAFHTNGVGRILRRLGVTEGSGAEPEPVESTLYRSDFFVYAHRAGIFDPRIPEAARVREGDSLGTIRNLAGEIVEEVRSPYAGVIVSYQSARVVHPGSRLYHGLVP